MPSKTIVWLGDSSLHEEMAQLGYTVIHIPLDNSALLTWENIIERVGKKPDIVLYADADIAPPLLGFQNFPCLTVFCSINSHIHSWHPMYAQGFDLVSVRLRDHLPRFRQRLTNEQVLWLPPCPLHNEYPPRNPQDKKWDLLHVSEVNTKTTPETSAFLKELKARFPNLEMRQGDFVKLCGHAKVILNITEQKIFNSRVFEALACGSCLVTPEVGHGQSLLFKDGKHLVTYQTDDMDHLIEAVCTLLADAARRESIAQAGFAEVNARHRPIHRAQTLSDAIERLDNTTIQNRLAQSKAIHAKHLKLIYLQWAETFGNTETGSQYLRAAMTQ